MSSGAWPRPASGRRESRELALVRDAVDVVLRRLAKLPAAPEVEELRFRAGDYVQLARGWQSAKPTAEQSETLMKRVLKLHVELAKLERQVPGS